VLQALGHATLAEANEIKMPLAPARGQLRSTLLASALLLLFSSPAAGEELLIHIVTGLFREGLIPPGSVVDAGTNTGVEACLYASLDPERTVHAVDPLKLNIDSVRRLCANRLPNVQPLLGGIGAERKTLHVPAAKSRYGGQMISIASTVPGDSPLGAGRDRVAVAHVDNRTIGGQSFEVWTLDELFDTQWRGERLAFAHWDTEGNELDILRGGSRTLRRDAPVFTVECVVHKSPQYTTALLEQLAAMGYETLLVEEEAGLPFDTRNLLNLPRFHPEREMAGSSEAADMASESEAKHGHRGKHWHTSATLQHLLAIGRLVRVNATSIALQQR